jgi:hypothetical protein
VVPDAGDPQALNRYAYAYNSPAVYTDPTGHFSFVGLMQIPVSKPVIEALNTYDVPWSWVRGEWRFFFRSDELTFFTYEFGAKFDVKNQTNYHATIRANLFILGARVTLEVFLSVNGGEELSVGAFADLADGRSAGGRLEIGYCPRDLGFGCHRPVVDRNYGGSVYMPSSAPTKIRIKLAPAFGDVPYGLRFSSTELSLDLRSGISRQNTCVPWIGCF